MKKEFTAIKKYIIAVFLLVLALGICAFYLHRKAARPDILLITIDALRADHLGCYGYARETSPNIDKLAKDGVVFLNCFAAGPGTAFSFPSLLTGKYLTVDKEYVYLNNILDRKFVTLAEYLHRAGYFTAAFVCNSNLREGKGFERGFDSYSFTLTESDAINEKKALDLLDGRRNKKPFFIWVHFIDPHTPYFSLPEGCLDIFMRDKLYGKGDRSLSLNPGFAPNPYTSRGYIPRITFQEGHYNLNYYIACYDCEIRHTDFYVGELLKKIKKDTLVIVSADHGEALGEHNYYFTHSENNYDELLHIPLIVKDNSYFKGGKSVATIASAVDIVPTILSRVRPLWYLFNKHRFDGIDLKIPLRARESKRRYVYSYCPWIWSIRDVKRNIKYILYSNGKEELYFLPDEETNHIDDTLPESIRVKEELKGALQNWRKDYPARADLNAVKTPLDERTKNILRHLGYLQ